VIRVGSSYHRCLVITTFDQDRFYSFLSAHTATPFNTLTTTGGCIVRPTCTTCEHYLHTNCDVRFAFELFNFLPMSHLHTHHVRNTLEYTGCTHSYVSTSPSYLLSRWILAYEQVLLSSRPVRLLMITRPNHHAIMTIAHHMIVLIVNSASSLHHAAVLIATNIPSSVPLR
jgi:hypothetical protein